MGRAFSTDQIDFYDVSVEEAAQRPVVKFTMRELTTHSESTEENVLRSARFIASQLPIRLARRLVEIQTLPYIMVRNPHLSKVQSLYLDAFRKITAFDGKIQSLDDEARLSAVLTKALEDNMQVVELLARGLRESTQKMTLSKIEVQGFLRSLLLSRIGQRVLVEQHLALKRPSRPGWNGIVHLACSPHEVFSAAAKRSAEICQQTFGVAPAVEFSGDVGCVFPFIPPHLSFIALELTKNAMRAVVEHTEAVKGEPVFFDRELPPIHIHIGAGAANIRVRMSDAGGGINLVPGSPRLSVIEAFKYGVTSVGAESAKKKKPQGVDWNVPKSSSPMAGFGFGLPLSRLYANHLGGDVIAVTTQGYGTDTYLLLDRSGDILEAAEM